MRNNSKKASEAVTGKMTMGLDLGDQHSHYYSLDDEGQTVESGRVKTSREGLEKRFGGGEPMRVVMEAGTHSPWVSRVLAGMGHEVIVANPRKVRLISDNDGKDDPVDAELLARLGRVDVKLLSPIQHRGEEAQGDLAVIRARDALVGARTQLVNHVRGAVKSLGSRLEKCSTRNFGDKMGDQLPEPLRAALEPVLEVIAEISNQIGGYDQQIRQSCQQKYPETALLTAVPGVGALTALGYVLTLEDPHRFANSRAVGSFLGLRPGKDKSGQQDPELRITKAGSPLLRRLLVGSAQYLLGPFGPDTDLRRWGLKLAGRGRKNAKKRAVVAVARKLAVLLHRLWVHGEVYEPLYQSERTVARSAQACSVQSGV